MKKLKIIKTGKIVATSLLLGILLSPVLEVSRADSMNNEEKLEKDIIQRMDKLGGDYQVAIKNLDGPSDLDLYLSSKSNPENLPAASSIKTFIGLATFDQVERGALEETNQLQKDIRSMLNLSDNQVSNGLIEKLGGFNKVNRTIIDITGGTSTSLNRYFLHTGKENMATAKDLNLALERIYRKDYVNEDHSRQLFNAMVDTSTKNQKLLAKMAPYDWAINKSGELPDRGVENDSALVKIGDNVFVITVLSKTNNIHYRKPQLDAIADVGKLVGDYYRSLDIKEEEIEEIPDNDIFSEDNIYHYQEIDLDKSYFANK